MNYIFKHAKLFRRYVILALKKSVEYQSSFYFNVVNTVANIAIWLVFWKVILANVPTYGGWDFPMMVILMGFFLFQEGLWILFWRVWNFADDIVDGYVTILLVKPLNPFLALIWRMMDIMRVVDVAMGFFLVLGGLYAYDFEVSVVKLCIALAVCLLGTLMGLNAFAMANVLGFWVGKTSFLRYSLASLLILEKTPLSVLPSALKLIYTFALPMIFVATYPTLIMTKLSLLESLGILALALVVAVFWLALFAFLWKKGVQKFESFGG